MRGKKSPLGKQLSKLKPQHRDWIVGQMRWELLRRNENYRKAYDEFATANPQCVPSSDSLKGKQKKRNHQDNQSDQVKIFDGSVLIPAATAFANKWGCFPRDPKTGETRFPVLHQNPGMVIPQFDEQSRSLSLRFPLNMSAEIILDQVKYWVSFYKKSHPARMMKMRLEDVLRAIAVYDLKTKERKVYSDIANELGLDGGDKGTGSDRAKDLFKTARTWIKRAEDPTIWMRTTTTMLHLQSGIVELQASAQAPEVTKNAKGTSRTTRRFSPQ